MTAEDIIEQILKQQPNLNRREVFQKLSAAKDKTGNLIREETLLRIIAKELGVEIASDNSKRNHRLSIAHLVSGLNDATVTARVIDVSSVKTFEGEKTGKYASSIVVDRDGMLRVVLWNDKAELVDQGKIKPNKIVRFRHGYTKQDRTGNPELHMGTRSEIEIDPEGASSEDYPLDISNFAMRITDVSLDCKTVNLSGRIKQISSISTFKRQDQPDGMVLHFTVADETGELPVVAWNERAAYLQPFLKAENEVQIAGGRVKIATNGEIEVHIDAQSFIQVHEPKKVFLRIADLSANSGLVNVQGEVASVPVCKVVTTGEGENIRVCSFDLKDDSGVVRIAAWRDQADKAICLLMGERLRIERVFAKTGYDGKLELSTRTATGVSRI